MGIEEGDARPLPSREPDLIRKKPLPNGKTENSGKVRELQEYALMKL